ncbi:MULTISPECIES: hypothetical protein [Nocardiaceae]|uniref:Lipoprotein n=1 Tax=Rhodococcoides corynebacterioides TaxID=53972 RepID=A0ABS2KUA0_9NOCA|nr:MULTISPECIES: hypothetical protein [Rhodococcus]MBM7415526.1 hypothetical protein [Rhodococcus corynebacterioides]MBP1117988.1 hypothetical protein [Rhodococcus sp. PvP016]
MPTGTDTAPTPTLPRSGTRRSRHLLVALALSVGLIGCATSGPAETSPEQTAEDRAAAAAAETVRRYFDAYNAGDVQTLNENSCAAAQRSDATPPPYPTIVRDIGTPVITGDSASVPVTMSINTDDSSSPSSTVTVPLVRDGGRWTFCVVERTSNG